METLSMYIYVILRVIVFSKAAGEVEGNVTALDWPETLNHTVIQFDPYVSILDKDNPYRYTIDELVSLVKKVASRFNKIMIQQSETDLEKDPSTCSWMSPLAAAEYNRLSNGTKLEVWLSYTSSNPDNSYDGNDFIFNRKPQHVIKRMVYLAQQANTIVPETVTTILLPYKLILNDRKYFPDPDYIPSTNLSRAVNQWGIIVAWEAFSLYPSFRMHISLLKPDIVIFSLPPLKTHAKFVDHLSTYLEKLEAFTGKQVKHGFIISVPDTDTNGIVNMSRLVTVWDQAIKWAKQSGTTVVLSQAFDKPSAQFTDAKTNGWWRLVENSVYKTAADFLFEEKVSLVMSADGRSSSESPKPLELAYSRNHVQIIFALGGNKQNTLPEETDVLLEKIAEKFHQVVLVIPYHSRETYRNIRLESSRIRRLEAGKLDVTIVLMPQVDLMKIIKRTVAGFVETRADYDYSQVLKPVTTFVVPFMGNETADIARYLKYTAMPKLGVSDDSYTLGYLFEATICSYYNHQSLNKAAIMMEYVKSAEAETLIFYFEEDEQTIKLGVDRMFQQRIVVLETCRKLVGDTRKLEGVKLSFMMLHYWTGSGFYLNKRDMVNYVDYLQRLSDWAEETSSTVILNNAVDGYRFRKQKGQYESEIGLWRYNGSDNFGVGRKHISGHRENLWIDKLDEIKYRFPDTNAILATEQSGMLSTYLIVLMSLLCALVIIGAIVTLVLKVRRHRTDEISHDFFKGADGEQTVALRFPYNRDRYEINSNVFSIQKDRLLGSGEFGKVMRGSFVQNGACINAAVKTVNSTKARRSAIRSLLLEIKILSYIGKHQNITELLAANTEDLQNGKVYMFLELCELGSLEKYLWGMRPALNDLYSDMSNMRKRKSELDERVDKYLDMVSRKGSLEETNCQDMYRWSQDICRGMEYLASLHVVHADLATRNVLLDSKKEAKICDFGLSRRMYNYTNYVKQQQEPLPWKWMSPEALRNFEFSEKSDVWAYGITMWEIYSLAEQPYPGLAWHIDFPDSLEEGLRLLEPKYCDKNVYWIMKECWQMSPTCRPTFADLMKMFD